MKYLKGRSQSFDLLDNFASTQIKSSNQELLYSKSLQAVEAIQLLLQAPVILQESYELPSAEYAHGRYTSHLTCNTL